MSEIASPELASRLRSDESDVLVLDIRPESSFAEWHVPGSRNINVYEELKENPESARPALEPLPKDVEIVTVCGAGVLSAVATDVLHEMGYDAVTLTDGMNGWGRVHVHEALNLVGDSTLVQVARPGTGCLSYILIDDGEAVVVDPSQYVEVYERILADRDAELVGVLETHVHADHVSGARSLAIEHGVPHFLHPADAGGLGDADLLVESSPVTVGRRSLTPIHTPGHTPGSVTLSLEDETLLTGDTLFLDGVGRPDLDGGSDRAIRERAGTLYESVQRLIDHSGDVLVFPAHHPGSPDPPTTALLSDLRKRNETLALDREAFVDAVTANVPETPPNRQRIKAANGGETSLDDDEAEELELGPNRCAAN